MVELRTRAAILSSACSILVSSVCEAALVEERDTGELAGAVAAARRDAAVAAARLAAACVRYPDARAAGDRKGGLPHPGWEPARPGGLAPGGGAEGGREPADPWPRGVAP